MTVGKRKNFPAPLIGMAVAEAPTRTRDNPNDDNKGVIDLPGDGTDPSQHNRNGINYGKKICFPQNVAAGESPNQYGGVNVITCNGTASSRGQGFNQEYNWSDGTDGRFNGNRNWQGGNRTGE